MSQPNQTKNVMSPEEQVIAHMKVLLNVEYERVQDCQKNLAAWTKALMVAEAQVATFEYRIQELQQGGKKRRVR